VKHVSDRIDALERACCHLERLDLELLVLVEIRLDAILDVREELVRVDDKYVVPLGATVVVGIVRGEPRLILVGVVWSLGIVVMASGEG
jgi:hypothetical protein